MTDRLRWIASGLCLAAFALLAWAARGESVLQGDVRSARWIQEWRWPGLDSLTTTANWSTRTGPLMVAGIAIVAALIWLGRRVDAALVISAVVIMHASYLLKELIASPRPTSDLVRVTEEGGGFGFPGGRAGNAVLFVGAVVWIAARDVESRSTRIAIWLATAIWVVVVGIARVRVGAHWPSDVIGAWLWTTPALLLLTWLADRLSAR